MSGSLSENLGRPICRRCICRADVMAHRSRLHARGTASKSPPKLRRAPAAGGGRAAARSRADDGGGSLDGLMTPPANGPPGKNQLLLARTPRERNTALRQTFHTRRPLSLREQMCGVLRLRQGCVSPRNPPAKDMFPVTWCSRRCQPLCCKALAFKARETAKQGPWIITSMATGLFPHSCVMAARYGCVGVSVWGEGWECLCVGGNTGGWGLLARRIPCSTSHMVPRSDACAAPCSLRLLRCVPAWSVRGTGKALALCMGRSGWNLQQSCATVLCH
jgi:hypothetical protein